MALKATILSRSSCTKTYGGLYTYSYPSQVLDTLPLICCSDAQTKQNVILKTAPDFPFRNECDILKPFPNTSSLRHVIDEVQYRPLLVLKHLDSNLLIESTTQKVQSSEVKHVAKAVLQALAALLEEGFIHTGTREAIALRYHHTAPDSR